MGTTLRDSTHHYNDSWVLCLVPVTVDYRPFSLETSLHAVFILLQSVFQEIDRNEDHELILVKWKIYLLLPLFDSTISDTV
jgi:hypothetical protein